MNRLESLKVTAKKAEEWAEKGEPVWVDRCLTSTILGFLSLAISETDDGDSALHFLEEHEVPRLLLMELKALKMLIRKVDVGDSSSSSIGGNYHYLVMAHIGIWLGLDDLAKQYLSIANREDVVELSISFWNEYAKAFSCLVHGKPYAKTVLVDSEGIERHWELYLNLMEVGSYSQEVVEEIKRSFVQRNKSGSQSDDSYAIEGSVENPTKVDFRLLSLVMFFGT